MIIAVANSKGGVGKSTISTLLAVWLHEHGHRVVLADCNTETSRALWLRADMAILPCKASMLEVWALTQNTSFVRQAQDIRQGPPQVVLVLSMVGANYRLTKDMRAAALALKLPVADTAVTLRQAYADGIASIYPAR